jgi:hypothetical protein
MAESKRFLLRLSPDAFEALRRWADEELRSINGQIEYLLTDQLRRAGRLPTKRANAGRGAANAGRGAASAGDDRDGRKRPRAKAQA